MNIKELKGTMDLSDFVEGLVDQKKVETLGAVWEDYVDCNHCSYREKCKAICDHYEDKGVDLYCGQVIDYLLGDLDLDSLPTEVEYNG